MVGSTELAVTATPPSRLSRLRDRNERLHALGSGLGVREYADKVGKSKSEIDRNRSAASVMQFCPHMGTELNSKDRHLAELHAAPRWLWRCAGNERPRPSGDVAGPLTKAPSR
jgi:hypothetical protein